MGTICEKIKPDISYPTHWEYRVIFKRDMDSKDVLNTALKDKEFKVKLSNKSSGGNYQSFSVKVLVKDEKERVDIFNSLKKISKFVL